MKLTVGLLVLCLSFVLTPTAIGTAWRIGAVDIPLDRRRMHKRCVPRAGGLAVFTAFSFGCLLACEASQALLFTMGGGAVLLLVGLADDIFSLPAWSKLAFQSVAAAASVVGSGLLRGTGLLWGVFWVIMLTNAHNFIDGLDGLLSGCAGIEGIALFLSLGIDTGMPALFLSLACIGFLPFNRHPACVFLGDCGSGMMGFVLGMQSLPLFTAGVGVNRLLIPLLLFAYPLCDLITAVTRRLLHGKSLFCADRGHLHHRICDAGLGQRACVRVLLSLSAGFCAIGVLSADERLLFLASPTSLAVALLLIRLRRFIENFT